MQPIGVLRPMVMRKLGQRKTVDIPLVWGGVFSGLLPEAVSSVLWRFGFFETYVSLTLLKFLKPGSTFVDVGAHFGYFSLFASKIVGENGQVLSVEAMPSTYEFLSENIRKNAAHPNVNLHQGAAFDKETELEFHDFGLVASSLNSAFGSRGSQSLHDGKDNKVSVKARTLDAIASDKKITKIDLVKIDAESSETFVLKGMAEIIKRDRPIIVTEVGDIGIENGTPSADQIRILKEFNYTPYKWHDVNTLKPFVPEGPIAYANLIFIPNERRGEI